MKRRDDEGLGGEVRGEAGGLKGSEGERGDGRGSEGGGKGIEGPRLKGPVGHRFKTPYSPEQKLMLLDTFLRSGLPMKDFADLVGVTQGTLIEWRKRFEASGPAGLTEQRKPKEGSRLPEVTRRSILMIKELHPEYGCERISDMLGRGPGLGASPGAVQRVLREAGYEAEAQEEPVHRDVVRRFERARPNDLWQSDIFTFLLKRQNRRVYLVGFLDDHSRFVTGYGLYASMSSVLVVETLRAGIQAYGAPREILTDQGRQYHTWRGECRFAKELKKLGITHILSRPRHPQTVGKCERFWGTLWRELVSGAVFLDLEDARRRIGYFIDHYNFQRPHQGIEGLVPADRFFEAAPEVLKTLRSRIAEGALSLAQHGTPRKAFYLTGRVGDVDLSIHAEGERVVLNTADGRREEVDLRAPGRRAVPEEEVPPPPWPCTGTFPVGRSRMGRSLRPGRRCSMACSRP